MWLMGDRAVVRHPSCSVVLVTVTDDLVRPLIPEPVPVVMLHGPKDKRRQQDQGADEVDDFHRLSPYARMRMVMT